MAFYEVIVGNVGKVYEGSKRYEALAIYNTYVNKSKRNEGRAAGESVDMYNNSEIIKQYVGTLIGDE